MHFNLVVKIQEGKQGALEADLTLSKAILALPWTGLYTGPVSMLELWQASELRPKYRKKWVSKREEVRSMQDFWYEILGEWWWL